MEKLGRRDILFTVGAFAAFGGLYARERVIEQGIVSAKTKVANAKARVASSSTVQEANAAMQDYTENTDEVVRGYARRTDVIAGEALVSAAYLTAAIFRTAKKA